jgi:hypothetical protein
MLKKFLTISHNNGRDVIAIASQHMRGGYQQFHLGDNNFFP